MANSNTSLYIDFFKFLLYLLSMMVKGCATQVEDNKWIGDSDKG